MSQKIKLFEEEEYCFKKKFYILMDLLITNQSDSRFESFLLMTIFYLQIISSFFSEQLDTFNPKYAKSDKVLNYIEKIIRIKDLFQNNADDFKKISIFLLILIIILIIHFFISIILISKNSIYSNNMKIINYYIKIFLYIGYNIIYDISFSNFSYNPDEFNPNFKSNKSKSENLFVIIISSIIIIACLFLYIFLNIYYYDAFYLSNSYYAKMSCNYDIFLGI